jgi:hypothetical protein
LLAVNDKNYLRLFVPFSFLLIFTIVRYVGFFNLTIYPTVDRATSSILFRRIITDSLNTDHIAIIFFGLSVVYFLIQKRKTIPILAGLGSLGVYFYFTNPVLLDIAALLMLPAALGIIIVDFFKKNKFLKPLPWKNLVYCLVFVVFCFEMFILSLWVAYPFAPSTIRGSIFWHFTVLEFEMFYALALAGSYLIIVITNSFFIKYAQSKITPKKTTPSDQDQLKQKIFSLASKLEKIESLRVELGLFDKIRERIAHNKIRQQLVIEKTKLEDPKYAPNILYNSKVMLSLALVISAIFAVYPYLPTINPDFTWVSVDDFNYQQFLKQVHEQDSLAGKVGKAFEVSSGDRPLTMLLMDAFKSAFNLDYVFAVRFFPIFLGPLLVFAAYYFVKHGTANAHVASYAALLTAVSHQVIVGMYAGFFANWLGLVAFYLALAMIGRFWSRPNVFNLFLVLGHSLLSFLLYIYVDVYFLLTLCIFLVVSLVVFRHEPATRKKIILLSLIFAVYAIVFVIRISFGSFSLFETIFERQDIVLSFREFQNRWTNFPYSMHFYVGGFLTNSAILALAFVFCLYAKYRKTFDRLLLSSLFAGSGLLLFGNEVLQSRILYDLPVQIAAAIALWKILNQNNVNATVAKIAFLLVTIHIAIYALRSMSNLTFGV